MLGEMVQTFGRIYKKRGCYSHPLKLFQKVLQLFEKALDVLFHSNVKTYLSMVTKVISPALIKSLWLMRYLLYLVKLPPPKVAMKMPRATAALEKTPMSVSAA